MSHKKDVFDEWKAGRVCAYANSRTRTYGHTLLSYAMAIGTRNVLGETVALMPFNVSVQTNADMHMAALTAVHISWGQPNEKRNAWWDSRRFITDPAMIGQEVHFYGVTEKWWAHESTAERNLRDLKLPAYAEQFRAGYYVRLNPTLGKYEIAYRYIVTEQDITVK